MEPNTTTPVGASNRTSTAPYAPEPSAPVLTTLEIGIGIASIFGLMLFFGLIIYLWRFHKPVKAWFFRTKNVVPEELDKSPEPEPIYIPSGRDRVPEPMLPQRVYTDPYDRAEYGMQGVPPASPLTAFHHAAYSPPQSYAAHPRASAAQSDRWI